jgi:CBS domain-containing protein
MRVRSAARLLDAAGVDAAPVVDSAGRCVGVFTASDYLRWLAADPATDAAAPPAGASDEVGHHMTRRFAVATPDTGIDELEHRMREVAGPFVVVQDRQRRPRGMVCGLTVLRTRSAPGRGTGE